MSKIWSFIIIFGITVAIIIGNVDLVINSVMDGSKASIENVISFAGMMCFWSGMFKILSETKIIKIFARKFSKILYLFFDKNDLSDEAVEYMSLNITSNMIGVGNAATINGIKSIKELQKLNKRKEIPNNNMTTFIVLNTASLQIIPTNMIALRALYNSENPASIIVPIWIVTICSLIVGIVAIKILNKRVI
ncbi:MAG: nucleoside recognition protein [Clostridia bacterium]|nr:nucleoside recognition protein [Clostridia bacterium]